jgi:hypothetical protein
VRALAGESEKSLRELLRAEVASDAEAADRVILAEAAGEIASRQKDIARAATAGDRRLLAAVDGERGDSGDTAGAAESQLAVAAIDTAGARAEGAARQVRSCSADRAFKGGQ